VPKLDRKLLILLCRLRFSLLKVVHRFFSVTHCLWVLRYSVTSRPMQRSQWPHGLRRESAAARLQGLQVRITKGHGCLLLENDLCLQVEVSVRRDDHSSF
jgi:hypothetical protein